MLIQYFIDVMSLSRIGWPLGRAKPNPTRPNPPLGLGWVGFWVGLGSWLLALGLGWVLGFGPLGWVGFLALGPWVGLGYWLRAFGLGWVLGSEAGLGWVKPNPK
jgi:hypothetical protein